MSRARRPLGALAILVLASPAHEASADDAPSLDARTWRPSIDPEANLVLEPPTTPGPWRWSVAAWAHYAYEPVALPDASAPRPVEPVEHLVGADLVAGLGIGERLALGVDVPVFVWQNGTTSLP